MIKPENYGKITENSRNLPEKSLKNPKNLPPADGWGAASADRRGFLKIFDDRGNNWLIPPYGSLNILYNMDRQ